MLLPGLETPWLVPFAVCSQAGTVPAQHRAGRYMLAQNFVFCGPQVSGTKPSPTVCIEYLLLAPRIKLTNLTSFKISERKKKKKYETRNP